MSSDRVYAPMTLVLMLRLVLDFRFVQLGNRRSGLVP